MSEFKAPTSSSKRRGVLRSLPRAEKTPEGAGASHLELTFVVVSSVQGEMLDLFPLFLNTAINSHELYKALLEKYLAITPFLLPMDPSDPGNQAVLCPPDLTPSSVFVSPETYKITSIIDWQHTVISPLLLATGHPRLFKNPDAESPGPPAGYAVLDPGEKAEVDELLRHQRLYYLYRIFNEARNKQHLSAYVDPVLLPRQQLINYAGCQWMGNLMTLREEKMQTHHENESMWFKPNLLVNDWRNQTDVVSEERWVRMEAYNHTVENNKETKAQCIRETDPDEVDRVNLGLPFRDREEVL